MFGAGFAYPPPIAPYWPAYPEPLRTQMREQYEAEVERFGRAMALDMYIQLACFGGFVVAIAGIFLYFLL